MPTASLEVMTPLFLREVRPLLYRLRLVVEGDRPFDPGSSANAALPIGKGGMGDAEGLGRADKGLAST